MKKIDIKELSGKKAASLAKEVLQVNMQVWLSTYPNDSLDITVEDIKSKFIDLDEKAEKNKKYYLENKDRRQWYAFDEEKLVGYCLAQIQDGVGKINSIYILKDYQGLGIGSRLLKKALEYMEKVPIEFECAKHNTPTIKFYKRHGFEVTDEKIKDYTFPSGKKMPLIKMSKNTNQNELITEVNENNEVIGLRLRSDFNYGRRIHRSSYLLLFDRKGRTLLQKRSKSKKWHPGKYTYPVAGTVADETYNDCMVKEIQEAFGKPIKFKKLFDYKHFDKVDKAFKRVFTAKTNSDNINLNTEYADSFLWITVKRLREDIKQHPSKYAPPFIPGMKIFFDKYYK